MTFKPKKDEKYWTYYRDKVFQATWWNDFTDNDRLREGRVFKTEKEAQATFKEQTF